MVNAFVTCIAEQMERKGFGKKRADEVVRRFEGLTKAYRQQGMADPELHAMTQAFDEFHFDIAEKSKRAMNKIIWVADTKERLNNPFSKNRAVFGKTNEALDPGRQAISFLDHDQGAGGLAVELDRQSFKTLLWSFMSDILQHASKGILGTERGKAHLENAIHEMYRHKKTGDHAAVDIARAWRKGSDAYVDLINQVGGSMRKLESWFIPQVQSAARMLDVGQKAWSENMMKWLDWSKMYMPDGSPIDPAEYDGVLKYVYQTLTTGGFNKLDPLTYKGHGSAIGNMLDEHRFLVFKDGDAWIAMHNAYGDGSIFDVMSAWVNKSAHNLAVIRNLTDNPRQAADTLKAMARLRAVDMDAKNMGPPQKGRTWLSLTNENLKKFDKILDRIMHDNPMNPDNTSANLVVSVGNALTGAQMGSAVAAAIPGDIATTAMVRQLNGMGLNYPVQELIHAVTDSKNVRQFAAENSFIFDEMISGNYAAQRWSGFNTYGPAWSQRLAEVTIRASGLNKWTNNARWVSHISTSLDLTKVRHLPIDQIPQQHMLRRYGITAEDWNAYRALPTVSPRPGVDVLLPKAIMDSSIAGKVDLFRKFQGMVLQEGRNMVPEGNVESAISLVDTTRPDTVPGAILHSFAMYKSFAMAIMNTYGRLAMSTTGGRMGRMKFVASLGASMFVAGALAVQLRELANGRDPMPMDSKRFFLKAALASGGMGIWGDFIFNGTSWVNGYGSGPEEVAAGPLVGFAGDTIDLAWTAATEGSAWVMGAEEMMKPGAFKTDDKAVQYASRVLPGSSLWWAKLAMRRQIFDRLAEVADPQAYKKRKARAKKQRDSYGNESYWNEGDRTPDRAPSFTGLVQ